MTVNNVLYRVLVVRTGKRLPESYWAGYFELVGVIREERRLWRLDQVSKPIDHDSNIVTNHSDMDVEAIVENQYQLSFVHTVIFMPKLDRDCGISAQTEGQSADQFGGAEQSMSCFSIRRSRKCVLCSLKLLSTTWSTISIIKVLFKTIVRQLEQSEPE